MYKIEKGLPIPKPAHTRERVYPFDEMSIGDSFAVAVEKRKGLATAIAQYSRKTKGVKFTTRAVTEGGKRVIRCWRVAASTELPKEKPKAPVAPKLPATVPARMFPPDPAPKPMVRPPSRRDVYDFGSLKVGESMDIPFKTQKEKTHIRNATYEFARKNALRLTSCLKKTDTELDDYIRVTREY